MQLAVAEHVPAEARDADAGPGGQTLDDRVRPRDLHDAAKHDEVDLEHALAIGKQ